MGHNGGPPLDDEDGELRAETAGEFDALMGMTVQDILREGQKALFARLVSRCRTGIANHQEMAILRNLLKDNGLTLGIPPEKPEEKEEPADLPEFGEPEFT